MTYVLLTEVDYIQQEMQQWIFDLFKLILSYLLLGNKTCGFKICEFLIRP